MKVNFIAKTRTRLLKKICATVAILFAFNGIVLALTVMPEELTYQQLESHIINKGQNPPSDELSLSTAPPGAVEFSCVPNAAWIKVSPANGTLTESNNFQAKITVSYQTSSLDPGEYTGIISFGGVNVSVSIKIIDPEISVWTAEKGTRSLTWFGCDYPPNEDMVFDRPKQGLGSNGSLLPRWDKNGWTNRPVVEVFSGWLGPGWPWNRDKRGLTDFYGPNPRLHHFKLWNSGVGEVKYSISVEYDDFVGWRGNKWDWINTISAQDGETGEVTTLYPGGAKTTINDSIDAGEDNWDRFLINFGIPRAEGNLEGEPRVADIEYRGGPAGSNHGGSLDPGTYTATLKINAYSTDNDSVARMSTLEVLIVLRVGVMATMESPLNLGDYYVGRAVAWNKQGQTGWVTCNYGEDRAAVPLTITYGSQGNRSFTSPTYNPDNTGWGIEDIFPVDENSNKLNWKLIKWGTLDASWISLSKTEGVLNKWPEEDKVMVEFDSSDLYPGFYNAYIMLDGTDGVGNPCCNKTYKFDPDNPQNGPEMVPDIFYDGTVYTLTLEVLPPSIAVSTVGVTEVLEYTDIIKDEDKIIPGEDIYIWNHNEDRGRFHYNIALTGNESKPVNWLRVEHYKIVNGERIPNPEQIVGEYDDPDIAGPDNRGVMELYYDTSKLPPGTHEATITITGDENPQKEPYPNVCLNSPVEINVSVQILGPQVALNLAELRPVCPLGGKPVTDDRFLVWNSDEADPAIKYNGSTLNYIVTADQDWISCSNTDPLFEGLPEGDSDNKEDKDQILVSYNVADMEPGTYTGTIKVSDMYTGDYLEIKVTMTVVAPFIVCNVDQLSIACDIGSEPEERNFAVWNGETSGTVLNYSCEIIEDSGWLTLTDLLGAPYISTGPENRRSIIASFNVDNLQAGKYQSIIRISAKNVKPENWLEIPVDLEIKAPMVSLDKTLLTPTCLEGENASEQSFLVWNGGFSILKYQISWEFDENARDWLICESVQGRSESSVDKQPVKIKYNTKDLEAGTYEAIISVTDPASSNGSEKIQVNLIVERPALEKNKNTLEVSAQAGDNAPDQTFQVWNSRTGTLFYKIEGNVDWISVNPNGSDELLSSSGEKDTISVKFDNSLLPIGTHNGEIVIWGYLDQNGTRPTRPVSVMISVILKVGAAISVSSNELTPSCYQGTIAESETFKVFNAGVNDTKLSYTITESIEWLGVSPKTGETEGEKDTITVTYNTRSLTPGVYTGKIMVSNDDEPTDTQVITVTLAVKSGAVIAIDSTSIDVSCGQGNSPDQASLQIWNSGKGILNFSVEAKDADYDPAVATAWIAKIEPATGMSTGLDDVKTSVITFDTSALTTGTYKGALTITDPLSENTPYTVDVNLSILGPTISLDPSAISTTAEAGGTSAQTFQVWNSGGGTLVYELADNADWLTLDLLGGDSIGGDDKDTITATCSAADLSSGTYEAMITVTSSTEGITNSPQTIAITFGVGMPEVATSVSKLSPKATSGTEAPEESFEVWNSSTGTLEYKISTDVAWVTVSPTSGDSTGESDKDELTVTYSTSDMAIGNYDGKITITDANAINSPLVIPITLTISDQVPDTGLLIQLAASAEGLTKDEENRVSFWPNDVNTGKLNNAQQRNIKEQPTYVSDLLNGNSALVFDLKQSMLINLTETTGVNARTIAMVFRTGGDISTRQVLFEQGDATYGFNFYIENKTFYANAWNLTNAGGLSQWGPISLNAQLLGYQTYYVTMVFDPDNAQIYAYLNGKSLGLGAANKMFYSNEENIVLGSEINGTKFPTDVKKKTRCKGLQGYIAEFLYYNEAISESTRLNLESYFQTKYNVTETDIRINDLALWLRADEDTVLIKNDLVKEWLDRADSSKKGIKLKQGSKKKRPEFSKSIVNNQAGVTFDGLNAFMISKNHENLNSSKTPYSSRSMFIAFKTGSDVTTRQVIWTEGHKKSGVNVYVESGHLYMGAWGTKAPKGEIPWSAVFLSASGIQANTVYCAQFNLDAATTMEGFLNGSSIGSSSSIGKLFKHKAATLGAVKSGSVLNGGVEVKKGYYFNGNIMELLVYNAILSASEVLEMENYLKSRYGVTFK